MRYELHPLVIFVFSLGSIVLYYMKDSTAIVPVFFICAASLIVFVRNLIK